jgi:aspartate/methionine/tyrosine aminotransferase
MISMEAARLLADRQRLLCVPGSVFGPGQENYLRLAFANVDLSEMPEIGRRLGECEGA